MKKSPITPQVAKSSNSSKYILAAIIAVLMIILVRGLFSSNDKTNAAHNEPQIVSVADDDNSLNLNYHAAAPPPPPSPPALPAQILPPPPPPPSILNKPQVDLALARQNDDSRIKAPTQVYSFENPAANSSINSNSTADPNSGFMQQAANSTVVTVAAKQDVDMDYKILQGKFIAAVLETSVNSDMPGMVRAVVSQDIYSDTGRFILIPRGTRLIGTYNSKVTAGQSRVMVVWTRAITPAHLDIALGSPNTDRLGQSGMDGIVDSHFWQVFGASTLLSVLGAATSNINPGGGELGVAGNPYQLAVTQGMMNASNNVLQTRINIKPTIQIPQGSVVQVFVARDLDFSHIATSEAV